MLAIFFLMLAATGALAQEGGFRGTYAGTVAVFAVDDDVAEAMLPPELELAPQELADSGHPIALLLNRETAAPPTELTPGNSYDSAIPLVLATQLKQGACDGETRFSFIPISYMNNAIAVAAGYTVFGLNSHLMDLEETATSWNAYAVDPLAPFWLWARFSGDVALKAPGIEPAGNLKGVTDLLGQRMIGSSLDGTLTWHGIDWKFLAATVVSRGVTVTARWPLALGTRQNIIPGIDVSPLGGFRIESSFDSTLPARCSF